MQGLHLGYGLEFRAWGFKSKVCLLGGFRAGAGKDAHHIPKPCCDALRRVLQSETETSLAPL